MMHKAWSNIEEVPYCFSRSSIKFQGHKALKIVEFDPNWAFPDCNSSLNSPMAMKCCTKLETAKERCPIVFQGHPSNFKVTRYKTSPILTQLGRFRTIGQSQLSNPSDLPCSRSSVKFQGHWGQKKSSILTQIGLFRTVTPVWIHQWLWNDTQSLKQHRRGALLFFKIIHQIPRSRGTKKYHQFWAFPDCNSSLTSPMDLKWCTKLDVV